MPDLDITLAQQLLLSAALGGIIGLEREIHGRPAGFRTHLLVSLGSCLFVITSVKFYYLFGNFSGNGPVGLDPARIAAQVVTGIGFLGAGAIIREQGSVRGLTTAACLWVVAGVGMACGIGLFQLAMCVTAISLLSLLMLKRVEKMLTRDTYLLIRVWGEDRADFVLNIHEVLSICGMDPTRMKMEKDTGQQKMFMQFQVKYPKRCTQSQLLDKLSSLEGVAKVSVE